MHNFNKQILVADDCNVLRYGLIILLKQLYPASFILEAENFKQVLKLTSTQNLDILILDANIADGFNIKMIGMLKLKQPGIKILIFSTYSEQLYAIRYLQAGAKGFISKSMPLDEVKAAITIVNNGGTYISQNLKDRLLDKVIASGKPMKNPLNALSNRELEVAKMLIAGFAVSEVSQLLNLQLTTVSTYKSRLLEKLHVRNIVQLTEIFSLYEHNISPLLETA